MAVPTSTYRLQIRPGFTLFDAAAAVPYLDELGVGAVYCSPLLTAASGSDHGYDTVDPTAIDADRGGEEGWAALVAACREHGLGIVVDIVPNHMGIRTARANPAWWSVLAEGRQSPYGAWFDVHWGSGPIVVPILGSPDDVAQVRVEVVDGQPLVRYFDTDLPVAPGTWSEGDTVQDVLARQHYRLTDWREANTRLNYRRFFSIVDLAGVRVDDPIVFDATHARVLRWIADGEIDGLRIDHPDGLRDPGGYLRRLRDAFPDGWIVSEKILGIGEVLPAWAHDGTVGYDALREVTQVLTGERTAGDWDRLWAELGGGEGTALECEDAGKLEVAETLFVTEARRIAALVDVHPEVTTDEGPVVAEARARVVEPRARLVTAVQAVAAQFRVYRTYLPFGMAALDGAVDRARRTRADLAPEIDELAEHLRNRDAEIAQRFQQLTGPVLAKGVEDTAFYRWNRMLALNEVGGDPGHGHGSLAEFHEAMRRRHETYPRGMTTLSTHDTKRSEDVRAMMLALAELPEVFEPFARHVTQAMGVADRGFAFALAQTIACGPTDGARVQAWVTKALREANQSSSWTAPDGAAEAAARAVPIAVLEGADKTARELWEQLQLHLMLPALTNSLSQKAIQLMMPGIPDVYQGTEWLDDSLVDPDNRRPVDFAARTAMLADLSGAENDVRAAKQWLVRQVLRLRRDRAELFGGYAGLHATGEAADHCVAFDRGGAVLVATRLPVELGRRGGWRGTTLALAAPHTDVLTGQRWPGDSALAELLAQFPCAILVRD